MGSMCKWASWFTQPWPKTDVYAQTKAQSEISDVVYDYAVSCNICKFTIFISV
ncbi:uncharacterized protein LACBIDRAFT_299126 [Laccaria bicolor S238N-H82]|uniref:Predicted protein n=1 Tax=Laccaria bicolor (strain S238N-H82 / ATCC MYA-4686) TaxID=486041 RepID=B0DE45_LACBS|nr:uncharacterized protein LACBIDRAFT_299126 [Laccaria bicolor S238N-H82]EDR07203.1 predicted protein [Laccaria bicolor S238N-H82]|eukprot:XP_001882134.1 predicted protein [Laccaria bicolor S238N-H82]